MEPPLNEGQRWREARTKWQPPSTTGQQGKPLETAPRSGGKAASPSDQQAGPTDARADAVPRTSGYRVMETSALLSVDKAIAEVTTVPPATLHRQAALSWGVRAVACYRVCTSKATQQEALSYFYLGEHYREAALAHAAMGEQWQDLAAEIDHAMADDRAQALAGLRRFSADLGAGGDGGLPPVKPSGT